MIGGVSQRLGSFEEGSGNLALNASKDPQAEIVDAGDRRAYARVHNAAAEAVAKLCGEAGRSFPLKDQER